MILGGKPTIYGNTQIHPDRPDIDPAANTETTEVKGGCVFGGESTWMSRDGSDRING